jgi:hypothetical protein
MLAIRWPERSRARSGGTGRFFLVVVENFLLDHDHKYESTGEGKTWTETNFGHEERFTPARTSSSATAKSFPRKPVIPPPAIHTADRTQREESK